MKKGISLIILVITIIVILILAGAVILSLSQNNPINSATEASFRSDIHTLQNGISLYIAKQMTDNNGIFDINTMNGTISNFVPELAKMDNYCKLINGKILYRTSDYNQYIWGQELGLIVDYTGKLVAEYEFDGNGNDKNGLYNGTFYGSMLNVTDRKSKVNGAMEFGSSGASYLRATLPVFNGDSTFSAWIYPKSYPSERSCIVLGSSCYYMSLFSTGNLQSYWYFRTPEGYHSTGLSTVPLNSWSFVTVSWDSTTAKLYINGSLKNTVNVTGAGKTETSFLIGSESGGRPFYGYMDDVRIYNRALSDIEISNLFNYIYW